MAASNNALRISELDFDSIKENLKEFLRTHSKFRDFDYEGSNWNALLDVLAYNTHYMGFYLNMVANEMFLDTAQLRDSVLSHAKLMNYVPTSKRGSVAYVDIDVTPHGAEDTSATSLTLNKYTKFISDSEDGSAYIFVANETDSTTKANGKFSFSNVQIKQGDVITRQQLYTHATNSKRRFNLPSSNCDTSTLKVVVQQSLTNTSSETYTVSDDITEVTANSAIYYLEENPESNGSYSITFGDGYLGKQPANGSVVIMTYLDVLGEISDGVSEFTLIDDINGYSGNVIVTTVSPSSSGGQKETIEEIKFRAPIAYTAQNRCVTAQDYKTLLLKDYPNIKAISVWGGQDNNPPVYGKVFVSMLPKDGYYITREEKLRIIDEIISTRSVLTVTPEIVDPEILYLVLNLTVRYDPKLTTLDESAIKTLVRAAILDYSDTQLIDFNDVFRSSLLLRAVDNADQSILSSELKLYVQKRVELEANTAKNYTVDFGVELKSGGIFDKISTYPSIVVQDSRGVSREVKFEEQANTLTGITSVKVTNGGTGYETAPRVTISGDGIGATANSTIVNGSVTAVNIIDAGTGYTAADVTFSGGKGDGATAIAKFDADRATLYSFYYGNGGKKTIVDDDAGTIRYNTGVITLKKLTPITIVENAYYANNYLSVTALPEETNIKSTRNKIVTIDEDDASAIQITMIAET